MSGDIRAGAFTSQNLKFPNTCLHECSNDVRKNFHFDSSLYTMVLRAFNVSDGLKNMKDSVLLIKYLVGFELQNKWN